MTEASIKKNTIYNTLKTASTILFPLITFPYISRVLQPENVGKINFGNSVVSYFSLIATLGVTTYATRECAKVKSDKQRLGETASEILSINLMTTGLAYVLLAVPLAFYGKIRDYRLLIIIQSLTIVCTTIGADWLNIAMEDFRYITIRTVAFQVISLVLTFTFVHKPDDYVIFAIITVLSSSGANVANAFYRRKYCKVRFTIQCKPKRHLMPILRLFAMLVAQQIFTMCDVTIIGLKLGDYEVGLYSTALKIYNVVSQVMGSILWVVMPQLSVAFAERKKDELQRILGYALRFSSTIGFPCAVGLFTLSAEIIAAVGGESYAGASIALRILALTLLAGLASNFTFNMNLLSAGRDKLCFFICLVAAVVNIVTNFILIPRFGIGAAAATTCASQVLIVGMAVPFLDRRIFSIEFVKMLFQPLAASMGLFLVVSVIKLLSGNIWFELGASVTLGGSLYFIMLLLMKNELAVGFLEHITTRWRKRT